jgi:hypothetical protein
MLLLAKKSQEDVTTSWIPRRSKCRGQSLNPMKLRKVSAPNHARPLTNRGANGDTNMNHNEHNDTHSKHQNLELSPKTSALRPVDGTEVAGITGGVGPVFDLSKVEGPSLPSWYLPVSPRISITAIR